MDVTLELDTRYHEMQKETNCFQERKPEASNLRSSHTQNSERSRNKKKNFRVHTRDKPNYPLRNNDHRLMGSEKEIILKVGMCPFCGGNNSIEACVKRPQNQLSQPAGRFPSLGKS
ncbi:hypothetical protein O181_031437 [Austropuccinia psidii MF-1]|uniref:Uncharacterized protein n=1 Tax=Austropuccinia psidii MF-1 TaxID=1389203 RepID=A0A9Q3CXL6_9BASI|nr:hypothetical protein [Austropuccinia psidii MF-1]